MKTPVFLSNILNRKMWMLWLLPLLVPSLWLMLKLYPRTIVVSIDGDTARLKMFIVLMENTRKHPNAAILKVEALANVDFLKVV